MTGLSGTSTGPNFLLNTAGSTSTVSPDPTTGATSKGFFANKAGVGVTFAIVGIVGALALILSYWVSAWFSSGTAIRAKQEKLTNRSSHTNNPQR